MKNNHFAFLHHSWERDLSDSTGTATTCLLKQGSLLLTHSLVLWDPWRLHWKSFTSSVCEGGGNLLTSASSRSKDKWQCLANPGKTWDFYRQGKTVAVSQHLKVSSILYSRHACLFLSKQLDEKRKVLSSN